MLRTYDFRLKLDAINGIIPIEFKKLIRPSMVCNWKKEKWNKLVGFDYYNAQEKDLKVLGKEVCALKESILQLKAEGELILFINKILQKSKEFKKLLRQNKTGIIDCVEANKKILGIERCCEFLQMHSSNYYGWKATIKDKCQLSKRSVCIKRHPCKLTAEEELKIIQLLQDSRYEHYPLTSLVWKAHYENSVHAGINVWRKIQEQNKIIRLKPKKKRKHSYRSLKAAYVNQYLHADITYFKLQNGKTYYIYIVKDNYSKYIKSWAVSHTVNADTRIKTFERALVNIDTGSDIKVSFITDNGSENRNNKVKKFFAGFKNIDIKYARLDIVYSNSMIEKYNKDLKYMYLYRDNIYTLKELHKAIEFAVKEHNYTKRMHCLKGQTPYEVYNGIPSKNDWIDEQWKQAKQNRYARVKNTVCCKLAQS